LKKELDEILKDLKYELKKLPYIKNPMIRSFELETSNEIRSNAIKSVCDAYKSGFTNLKNGTFKYFNMNFKRKNEQRKCIELANSEINMTNGKIKICPGKLGKDALFLISKKNQKKYKTLKINNNCDLIKRNGNFYVYVSIPIQRMSLNNNNFVNFCGVDPGIRTFATVYGNESISKYKHKENVLKKLNKKIDLIKLLRKRKCKITKVEKKKADLVDHLHWLTINDLLKKNDIIFYRDIKSHDIVKNGKNKTLNRNFNDLKFYVFKKRLIYKALRNGKKVFLTNESYTTQGCSKCGNLWKDIGSSELYKCQNRHCNFVNDRDVNASKNICMKGIMTYMS